VLKVTLKHAGLTLTIHDPDRFRSLRVGERRLPGESEVQDTLSLDGVTFRITRDDPNLCRAQAELEAGRTKSIGVRPMENTPENMEDPYGWTWFDWTATEYRGCMVCGDPAHYNLATSTHYSLIVPKNADGKPVERFLRWIQDGLELAGCKK
jgi:hypothetical protein